MPDSLRAHELQPIRLLCPRDFPGKNTRVGYHFLLQGTFLTQGWNPCLLLDRRILYPQATWEAISNVTHWQNDLHDSNKVILSYFDEVL